MSLTKPIISDIIYKYMVGEIGTDSDIEDYVSNINRHLVTWTPEEEEDDKFYESKKFKNYINHPQYIGFSDVEKVIRRFQLFNTPCSSCKHIINAGAFAVMSPCCKCSRIHKLEDCYEKDAGYEMLKEVVEEEYTP